MAIAMAVPVIFIYGRLLILFKDMDIFDMLISTFGKFFGKVLSVLYIWYAVHLGSLVTRNFSEFIQVSTLDHTPQFFTIALIGLLCILAVKSGIEVLGRWSLIGIIIVILIVVLTALMSLNIMNFDNILPIADKGFSKILGVSYGTLTFPFSETVLFLGVLSTLKPKVSPYKAYYFGVGLGGLLLFIVVLRNTFILGGELLANIYFPSYISTSIIILGSFLSRFEEMIGANILVAGLVKISICLYVACVGIYKVLNLKNYRSIVVPTAFFMMTLACIVYTSTMQMFNWLKIYSIYAIPFQFIIPILLLVIAEIKEKIKRSKQEKENEPPEEELT
jgi:spore germination protein KB